MNWAHWIGRKYYSIPQFIEESRQYGITRRVSLNMLKKMSWGDVVSCIQREPGLKSGTVFLEFPIEMISGLSTEAQEQVVETFPCRQVDEGGLMVARGCGDYITAGTYEIDAPMANVTEFIRHLAEKGEDVGQPMIGCRPESVEVIGAPTPLLRDVPFRPGFRDFDRDSFWDDVAAAVNGGKKRPILTGQYYLSENGRGVSYDEGRVQAVKSYRKGG